jgi:hypothetical protein
MSNKIDTKYSLIDFEEEEEKKKKKKKKKMLVNVNARSDITLQKKMMNNDISEIYEQNHAHKKLRGRNDP